RFAPTCCACGLVESTPVISAAQGASRKTASEAVAMPAATSDRNLLFGILALQMDFISRDALVAAMNAWLLDKAKPLGQLLVEQSALQPGKRALLESLVEAHLEMHGHDVEKSLAALAVPAPLRHELHSLGDGDVQASLAQLPTPTGADAPPALP